MKFATHFCLSHFLRTWFNLALIMCLLTAPAYATNDTDDVSGDEPSIQETTLPIDLPAPDKNPAIDPGFVPDESLTLNGAFVSNQVDSGERPKNRLNSAAWITDSTDKITARLNADSIYTVHVYVDVVGDVAAEGARIWVWSNALFDWIPIPSSDSKFDYSLCFGADGENVGYDDARASLKSATEYPLKASYVPGSAKLAMAGEGGTVSIKDVELGNYEIGAYLGYDAADGSLPVGREYACEITFQIKTEPFAKTPSSPINGEPVSEDIAKSPEHPDNQPSEPDHSDDAANNSDNSQAEDAESPADDVTNAQLKTGIIANTIILAFLSSANIVVAAQLLLKNKNKPD